MTPKEKALLLIRRFYSIGAIECKQCALIAKVELNGWENINFKL
jgi:hypothetical protein